MATYIVASYCPTCDKYFKAVGRDINKCNNCDTQLIPKTVEKYSINDPNVREKVINVCYAERPRYSVSMGVSETQIAEAKKLHPETEWKKFGHSYRPLIKHRGDKLRMMKQCGMEEFDTKQFNLTLNKLKGKQK